MRVENGLLILEKKDCSACRYQMPGFNHGWKVCPVCGGTGRGIRGGKGRCKGYCTELHRNSKHPHLVNLPELVNPVTDRLQTGTYMKFDWDNPVVCVNCNGNYRDFEDETVFDTIPVEIVTNLPLTIHRSNAGQTFMQAYIGVGLFSVTDYGRHQDMTDAQLIESVRKSISNGSTQALKVTNRETLEVADEIRVITNRNGYDVVGYLRGDPIRG